MHAAARCRNGRNRRCRNRCSASRDRSLRSEDYDDIDWRRRNATDAGDRHSGETNSDASARGETASCGDLACEESDSTRDHAASAAGQHATRSAQTVRVPLAVLALTAVGCGSGIRGTYADQTGSFVLDLEGGGKASFTIPGDAIACHYQLQGETLTLDCPGDAGKLVLTVHGDGSMTGPRDSFMPALRKKS